MRKIRARNLEICGRGEEGGRGRRREGKGGIEGGRGWEGMEGIGGEGRERERKGKGREERGREEEGGEGGEGSGKEEKEGEGSGRKGKAIRPGKLGNLISVYLIFKLLKKNKEINKEKKSKGIGLKEGHCPGNGHPLSRLGASRSWAGPSPTAGPSLKISLFIYLFN